MQNLTDMPTADRVEAQVRQEMAKGSGPLYSRRAATARLMRSKAEVIADDVLTGATQWQPRLEEYALLRKLVEESYA